MSSKLCWRDNIYYKAIDTCRLCSSDSLQVVIDLGITPLADRLISDEDLEKEILQAPLKVVYCSSCHLVQLLHTVDPKILFYSEYPYFSSVSSSWLAHNQAHANQLIREKNLTSENLVAEIGSNDGYLLQYFFEAGISIIGVDPTAGPAQAANVRGINTIQEFFSIDLAKRIKEEGFTADVVIAKNVLAHVVNLNDLVTASLTILKPDGIFVIEVPYLLDLIRNMEFDTIYHQHLCYFSVSSLLNLATRHRLQINKIEKLKTHGGSLRVTFSRGDRIDPQVEAMIAEEIAFGIQGPDLYLTFADQITILKEKVRRTLAEFVKRGQRLGMYGAAAKATTLYSYFELQDFPFPYVADKNPYKQGKYFPAGRLPIRPPDALLDDQPDIVLLTPWNIAEEIMAQEQEFLQRGGAFLVPIPMPHELRL